MKLAPSVGVEPTKTGLEDRSPCSDGEGIVWSGIRESNSFDKFGKLGHNRYANSA